MTVVPRFAQSASVLRAPASVADLEKVVWSPSKTPALAYSKGLLNHPASASGWSAPSPAAFRASMRVAARGSPASTPRACASARVSWSTA